MAGTRRNELSTRVLTLATAMLLGGACVVSPQPLPPVVPTIDLEKLSVEPTAPDGFILHGDPGAVTADATMSALGIVSSAVDAVAVAPDGSFDLTLTADAAQRYRLEAILDGERSVPLDIEVPTTAVDGKGVVPASPAYSGCLTVTPATLADRGEVAVDQTDTFAIQLQNGCAEDLVADDIRLADGASGFTVSTAAPLSVPAGNVAAVSVAFAPTKEGDLQDVLVVHMGGSAPGFIVVTLRGEGTP